MESKRIKLSELQDNRGQIEGLPTNPRQWSSAEVASLAKSIEQTPELLEARGIIVLPHNGKYVVLGGNMRLAALKTLGHKEAPCIVLPEDTPVEKLKEIVIKDNGSFGKWDMEALANEWDDLPLSDWGGVKPIETKIKEAKDHIGDVPFTEVLGEHHNYIVLYFDNDVDWLQCQSLFDIQPSRCLSTAREKENIYAKKLGIGRVLRGAEALNKIINFGKNED